MYGSVHNRVMERSKQAEPEVGMGATVLMWSDRYAATIVEVQSTRSVFVQRDRAIRTDSNGMSESQSYRYEPNTEAPRERFTLRKNGRWIKAGDDTKDGTGLLIGARLHYHDFSY